MANGTGLPSGDTSELKVVPFSLSAVYRFDYFLQTRDIPLVPFGKVGLDWAYWQITDGNGNIADDDSGGHGRGGTLGWHVAGGLALVLDLLDPDAAHDFDSGPRREPHRADLRVLPLGHLGPRRGEPAARRRQRTGRSGSCSSFEPKGRAVR